MIQRTLVLIKPDAVVNYHIGNIIDRYGEAILLLGVRKAESASRSRTITSREIEGKLLVPHSDILNAYVYNPLTEIKNERVCNTDGGGKKRNRYRGT